MTALPVASEIRGKRPPPVRVADLLCGAGGSSTGAELAIAELGREMELVALNHWDIAIATHSANHPTARHFCQDIETVKPRDAVPDGVLDLLLASPECTQFSQARGGRPIQDQKRATPWCVPNWCASLYVRAFIVENVPELQGWGPIDSRGRPIKKLKGKTFLAWIESLKSLGYRVEWRVLNAADYGDPTTRRRLFILGRRDGRRIRWPDPTHSQQGGTDLLGHTTERWRAAREVIDWSRKGRSVFLRKVPLKPNTLRRLKAGALRFFGPWAAWYAALLDLEIERSIARWGDKKSPKTSATRGDADGACLIQLRGTSDARSLGLPLPAVTAGGKHLGVAEAFVFPANQGAGRARGIRSADEPLSTILTRDGLAAAEPLLLPQGSNQPTRSLDEPLPTLVTHGKPAIVEPLLLRIDMGGAKTLGTRNTQDPLYTITTAGGIGIAEPFLLGQHAGNAPRSTDEPLMTLCAGGAVGIAEPFVATLAHGNEPGERDPHSRRVASPDEPLGTITAGGGKYGVAEAFLMPVTHGGDPGRVCSPEVPLPTITTANRGEYGVAAPFIAPYYGSGSGTTGKSVDEPLDTITAKDRFALAEAFLVPNFGEREGQPPRTHDIAQPLPAVTSHGAGGLAEPAFLLNRHGDRPGGPRAHAVDEPLPTVTTRGAGYLVTRYGTDLLFRMLDNDELAAGTSFDAAPRPYVFVGKKDQVTKQIGNAVPVRLSKALVRAVLES
ncbi:MAG TPA: DNA cytosine methyltransferase [Stellaceae bacterium]|jgi:DNA (cytosine-5)-methyltransferase 1|nr:DNA cytosine methyltransferase [Stellaceae bacterium]